MGARTRRTLLTAADLPAVTRSCGDCGPGAELGTGDAWAVAAMRRWGFIGVGVWRDDAWVEHALVAPSLHVPRSHPGHGRCYADPRAAVLLSLRLGDGRGERGRPVLLESLAGRLRASGSRVDSLESLATTGTATCATPRLDVLESAGFRIVDADPLLPVCRLDLRNTVLTRAWEQVRHGLRLPTGPVRPTAAARRPRLDWDSSAR